MSRSISKVYGKINTMILERTSIKLLRDQQKEIFDDYSKFCTLAQARNIIIKNIMQEEYGTVTNQWEKEYDGQKADDIPDFDNVEPDLPVITPKQFREMRKEEKTNDPEDLANEEN